jgi:hypothetical protein
LALPLHLALRLSLHLALRFALALPWRLALALALRWRLPWRLRRGERIRGGGRCDACWRARSAKGLGAGGRRGPQAVCGRWGLGGW